MEDDKRGVPPPEAEVVATPTVEVVTEAGLIRRPPPPPPAPPPPFACHGTGRRRRGQNAAHVLHGTPGGIAQPHHPGTLRLGDRIRPLAWICQQALGFRQ